MEDLEKLAKCKRGDMVYVPRYNYGAIERHRVDNITVKRAETKKKKIQSVDISTTFDAKKYSFSYKGLGFSVSSSGAGDIYVTYDDALEYVKENIEWMIYKAENYDYEGNEFDAIEWQYRLDHIVTVDDKSYYKEFEERFKNVWNEYHNIKPKKKNKKKTEMTMVPNVKVEIGGQYNATEEIEKFISEHSFINDDEEIEMDVSQEEYLEFCSDCWTRRTRELSSDAIREICHFYTKKWIKFVVEGDCSLGESDTAYYMQVKSVHYDEDEAKFFIHSNTRICVNDGEVFPNVVCDLCEQLPLANNDEFIKTKDSKLLLTDAEIKNILEIALKIVSNAKNRYTQLLNSRGV